MRGTLSLARLESVAKGVRFRWCEPVDRLRNPVTLNNGLHPTLGAPLTHLYNLILFCASHGEPVPL